MNFKLFRERVGLSQRDVAQKLNIQQPSLVRYENQTTSPSVDFLKKYCETLDANPNFLLFNKEPYSLSSVPSLTQDLASLINDALLLFSADQLKLKLQTLLLDEILDRIPLKDNLLLRILDSVYIGGDSYRCRPFLFLYYIFNIIQKDPISKAIINNYKAYVIDQIRNFDFSMNESFFTSKIQKEMIDFFDLKVSEDECKFLVEESTRLIGLLESRMPTVMVKMHRSIFHK